jgi:hypothetical protein
LSSHSPWEGFDPSQGFNRNYWKEVIWFFKNFSQSRQAAKNVKNSKRLCGLAALREKNILSNNVQ